MIYTVEYIRHIKTHILHALKSRFVFCIVQLITVFLVVSSSLQAQFDSSYKYQANISSGNYVSGKKKSGDISQKDLSENIACLPISFRQNKGQWDDKVLYQGSAPGWNANVSFMKNGLSFAIGREKDETGTPKDSYECLVWNLHFDGANENAIVSADGRADSYTNYLIGDDLSRHGINVPDYKIIRYSNVYDNIDLNYYSNNKKLKYDYILKPGADIKNITLSCEGINALNINVRGELEISTKWGTFVEQIPESYQFINGEKIKVKIAYELYSNNSFGFKSLGDYDNSATLVIDPVILEWSTFVGGAGATSTGPNGYLFDFAIDAVGDVYATGWYTGRFPITPGAYDTGWNGGSGLIGINKSDVFVFKLNSSGSSLIYATYIGGSSNEEGLGIKVNQAGEAYITGKTLSADFPKTAGAYDTSFNSSTATRSDVFFCKLSADGLSLLYSTFIGGARIESANAISLNSAGEAFITGITNSLNFPFTPGVVQPASNGMNDAFVIRINPLGAGAADLVFSTFLGGADNDSGNDISLTSAGEIVIAGATASNNFPFTTGAYDIIFNAEDDAFVTKLSNDATILLYSTYLGGSAGQDAANALTVNNAGEIFVTGYTESSDFPVIPGAYDLSYNGGAGTIGNNPKSDIFVSKIAPLGGGTSDLIFSTFMGGSGLEEGLDIELNTVGNVYVAGSTTSLDFPATSCAYNNSHNGGARDAFLFKMDATASNLLYSTYFGGDEDDYKSKLALFGPCKDEVYMSSTTHSANFPTTSAAFHPQKLNLSPEYDQPVVFKFKPQQVSVGFTSKSSCGEVSFTDTSKGNCIWSSGPWMPSNWRWDFGDGNTSIEQNPTHIYATAGTFNVKLVIGCPMDSITIPVTTAPVSSFSVTLTSTSLTCNGNSDGVAAVMVTGGTGTYTYTWSNLQTTPIISQLTSGIYSVTVTDANGCSNTTSVFINQPAAITLSLSVTTTSCSSADGAVTIVASGGTGAYTYSWSNNATTPTITGLSAANYQFTVTDANFCTQKGNVQVSNLSGVNALIISTASLTCYGLCNAALTVSGTGGTPPYFYRWNNGIADINLTGLCAGRYTATVTDSDGCISSTLFDITEPALLNATLITTNINCFGGNDGSATIVAVGGTATYTYAWSNLKNTETISQLTSGIYSVTVTDVNGCTDTISTVILEPSAIILTLSATDATCNQSNGSISAIATGGTGTYSYRWNNNSINSAINNIPGGFYSVTVTDANGCSMESNVNIASGTALTINISPDTTIISGDSATLIASGGTSYQWSPEIALSCATCANPTASPESTTVYCVVVTDANGCSESACVTVAVDITCNGIFVPNVFSPNDDGENDLECVFGNCIKDINFTIYDRWGEKVFQTSDPKICWDGIYKSKKMKAGTFVYYLDATLYNKQVIIKRGNITLIR